MPAKTAKLKLELLTPVTNGFANPDNKITRNFHVSTCTFNYIGRGAPELDLTPSELREIVTQGLLGIAPGARVLAILPDKTRDDNTDILFPAAAQFLASRQVAAFDALIAQGTHVPMTEKEKLEKVGMLGGLTNVGAIFDHKWDSPDELVNIGSLSAKQVTEITGGLLNNAVPITLNKLITNYDTILVFGATVPHEVAGFAGGGKYFFPGIAERESLLRDADQSTDDIRLIGKELFLGGNGL